MKRLLWCGLFLAVKSYSSRLKQQALTGKLGLQNGLLDYVAIIKALPLNWIVFVLPKSYSKPLYMVTPLQTVPSHGEGMHTEYLERNNNGIVVPG